MLFESIHQPFHPLAEAIEGPMKGSGPACVLLARHGEAHAVAPEVVADRATAGGFVANEATRPAFGAPAPAPFHDPAFPQGFEGHGVVPWPRGEAQRHQLAPACRAARHFGADAAWTAAKRFGLRAPSGGPSGRLVCPDHGAIHRVALPVQRLCGVSTLVGNVVITRAKDVIKGQYGVMDLNNNVSRMLPAAAPGAPRQRVQGLFVRQDQGGTTASKTTTAAKKP